MSRFRTSITINMPQKQAHTLCRVALSHLGWTISGVAPTRIAGQEAMLPATSTLSPVRIAVILGEQGDGSTELTLHGVSFGCEPLQDARVRDCVAQFRAVIEQQAGLVTPSSPEPFVPAFLAQGHTVAGRHPAGSPGWPMFPAGYRRPEHASGAVAASDHPLFPQGGDLLLR